MDEDMVVASSTLRDCDQCGQNEHPRVFLGMGLIFNENTGEGAACLCVECLRKAIRLLDDRRP